MASATSIHKGLCDGGVGQALAADAKIMLVAGEFDAQCDEEFRHVLAKLLADGMPMVREEGASVCSLNMCSMRDGS